MRKLVVLATFFTLFLVVPVTEAAAAPRYIDMEIGVIAPNVANTASKVWVFVAPKVEGDPVPTGEIKLTFLGSTIGSDTIHYCADFELHCAAIAVTGGLVAGIIELNASYAGDANYSAVSTGPVGVEILNRDTTATLTSSVGSADTGSPVTLAFTLAKVDKFPVAHLPKGNVEFWDRTTGTHLGSAPLNSDWSATATMRSLKAGTHAIDAAYTGGDGFSPVKTGTINVVVNGASSAKPAIAAPSAVASTTPATATTQSTTVSTDSTTRTEAVQKLATTPVVSKSHASTPFVLLGAALFAVASALLGRNARRYGSSLRI